MITGRNEMSEYKIAKKQIDVSVGESVRIIRELQGMSQNEVARLSGIPRVDDFGDRKRSDQPGGGTGQDSGTGAQVPPGRPGISGLGN